MKNIWCNNARFQWYRHPLHQIANCGGGREGKLEPPRFCEKNRSIGLAVVAHSGGLQDGSSTFHRLFKDRCTCAFRIPAIIISHQPHNQFQIHPVENTSPMKLSASSLALFAAAAAFAPGVSAFAPSAAASPRSATARMMELFATKKVFIDGEAGTTGLQVRDRLGKRTDIEIISPPSELRKDEETRKKFINEADAVILCALNVAICITNIDMHADSV